MAELSIAKYTLSRIVDEETESIYIYCPTTNMDNITKILEEKIASGISMSMSEGMETNPSYYGEESEFYYMIRVVITFLDDSSTSSVYGWMFSSENVENSEEIELFIQGYFNTSTTSVRILKYAVTNI